MSCIHGDDPTKCISCEMLRKRPMKLMERPRDPGKPRLGQDTGKEDEVANAEEARLLLRIIHESDPYSDDSPLNEREQNFISDLDGRNQMFGKGIWRISGKTLFKLRDIKDKCL